MISTASTRPLHTSVSAATYRLQQLSLGKVEGGPHPSTVGGRRIRSNYNSRVKDVVNDNFHGFLLTHENSNVGGLSMSIVYVGRAGRVDVSVSRVSSCQYTAYAELT